jgi:hypothetical protein
VAFVMTVTVSHFQINKLSFVKAVHETFIYSSRQLPSKLLAGKTLHIIEVTHADINSFVGDVRARGPFHRLPSHRARIRKRINDLAMRFVSKGAKPRFVKIFVLVSARVVANWTALRRQKNNSNLTPSRRRLLGHDWLARMDEGGWRI